MQRPALATPCPLALRSAAAWTRTGTGTRARTRPAPRACPDSTTRRPCRGRLSFGEQIGEITGSFKSERLGGAHAHRTQLQRAQIRDDADAQIAVCEQQCGAGARPTVTAQVHGEKV